MLPLTLNRYLSLSLHLSANKTANNTQTDKSTFCEYRTCNKSIIHHFGTKKLKKRLNNQKKKIFIYHTWDFAEDLDRLVHGLVSFHDILLNFLSVDGGQRVIHPTFLPAQPV
jgi:hypothetical protein